MDPVTEVEATIEATKGIKEMFPDAASPSKAQVDLDQSFNKRLYQIEGRLDAHCETFVNYHRRVAVLERELRMMQLAVLMLAAAVYVIQRELYAVPDTTEVVAP